MKNLKWFTRILALLLVAVMILAGCAPAATVDPTDPPATENKGNDETKAPEADKPYWELLDEVSDTSELPDWEGETLEITMWVVGPSDANLGKIPETDVAFKELERVTGIKYNIEESFGNGGNAIDAKLPMVLASRDLPHIILGYGHTAQLLDLFENDYLVDLTEYYEDGTLDQLTRVFPLDETWNYVYTNMAKGGKIYGIPTILNATETEVPNVWDAAGLEIEGYNPTVYATYIASPTTVSGAASDGPTIREDLLQAVRPDSLTMAEIEEIYAENGSFTAEEIYHVGLKSADDFWDLLRDIKAEIDANPGKYLDANGNEVEIMAGIHTEEDNWRYSVNLMGALYNAPAGTNYFAVMNYEPESEDAVLEWGWTSELYQDHWKNMNDMVQEGIISANSFVDNKAAFQEKMNAAHYVVHYGGNYYTDYQDENGEYTYRYVPVWVDSEFNTMKQGGTSAVSYAYCFSLFEGAFKDEAEIEQFLHAINYLNSDVGVNNFVWGPKSAGLFTEDENGVRSYATEALYNDMIGHSGTGESTKYGLYDIYGGENLGDVWFPKGIAMGYLSDDYAYAGRLEAKASDGRKFFNPGTLEGKSKGENNITTLNPPNVHQFGRSYEWGQTFWAARTGFENQIKKMIVAKDDAEYQKELDVLNEYCETYALTDEALAEFNKEWVNANRTFLQAAGIVD